MTVDPDPEPHLFDLSTLLLCTELDTYLCTIPTVEDLPPGAGIPAAWAGQTGVVFEFTPPGLRKAAVFVPASAFPAGAGAEFHELMDKLHDPATAAKLAARAVEAHEANYLAGYLADSPVIHCPGCGARLFAEVARRGGCLACYPDLPPGDAVEVAP